MVAALVLPSLAHSDYMLGVLSYDISSMDSHMLAFVAQLKMQAAIRVRCMHFRQHFVGNWEVQSKMMLVFS